MGNGCKGQSLNSIPSLQERIICFTISYYLVQRDNKLILAMTPPVYVPILLSAS